MMSPQERRDRLTSEGEAAQIGASLIITIGILIELFGAGAMLGAAVKSASSLILFWGMFVCLVGVIARIYSRYGGSRDHGM